MFEPLETDTPVQEQMTYAAGSDLLVTFNHRNAHQGDYGYDLYDFDDFIFQTSPNFTSLEDAKCAAMEAAALLNAE